MCYNPIEIAKRLVERGYKLTIVNSDKPENHENKVWSTAVFGKNDTFWLSGEKDSTEHEKRILNRVDEADVYLVDWAILPHIAKALKDACTSYPD